MKRLALIGALLWVVSLWLTFPGVERLERRFAHLPDAPTLFEALTAARRASASHSARYTLSDMSESPPRQLRSPAAARCDERAPIHLKDAGSALVALSAESEPTLALLWIFTCAERPELAFAKAGYRIAEREVVVQVVRDAFVYRIGEEEGSWVRLDLALDTLLQAQLIDGEGAVFRLTRTATAEGATVTLSRNGTMRWKLDVARERKR